MKGRKRNPNSNLVSLFIFLFNFIVRVISLTTVFYLHLVDYSGNAEKGESAGEKIQLLKFRSLQI